MTASFKRSIFLQLQSWLSAPKSKPLVVRGARQVGKTYAIKFFAEEQGRRLVYFNLELDRDLEIFSKVVSAKDLLETIEIRRNISIDPTSDIVFIDEIQNSKEAMVQLRYFYEEQPELKVVAAGSLLEVMIQKGGFNIPVGRAEYLFMHPCSFSEYLGAQKETKASSFLQEITTKNLPSKSLHAELQKKYAEFAAIGGMPEAVATFTQEKSLVAVKKVHQALINGYMDDVYKYAKESQILHLRFVINHAPELAGSAIKYEGFANSKYKSREISQAIQTLESAKLLSRSFPSASTKLPLQSNYRRAPKLFFLDSGIVASKLNVLEQIFKGQELNQHFEGRFAEQIVFQAFKEKQITINEEINYWLRDKKNSSAEVDVLYPYQGEVLPLEVKSGAVGKLKSLNQFVQEASAKFAIRVWDGELQIDELNASNCNYKLLSLPFYLLERLDDFLDSEV